MSTRVFFVDGAHNNTMTLKAGGMAEEEEEELQFSKEAGVNRVSTV